MLLATNALDVRPVNRVGTSRSGSHAVDRTDSASVKTGEE
jgi:hypothetical protein